MLHFNRHLLGKRVFVFIVILTAFFFLTAYNCLGSTVASDNSTSITQNEQSRPINNVPVDNKNMNSLPTTKMSDAKSLTVVSECPPEKKGGQYKESDTSDPKIPVKKAVNKSEDTKKARSNEKTKEEPVAPPEKDLPKVKGYAFVNSVIKPLDYELNERFWGWRPNDIINFTDNINNIQRGILEVIRRTAMVLAHRLSRTGSNDTLDENLENAMNWLMIKADQYWFPSPESKYNLAIDELRRYLDRLERGRARFFVRTDNLIPLFSNYEDLLGGCDQSLTIKEDDDGPINSAKADNYFYYAQGVAIAMGSIFRGVRKDFFVTLESVQGTQILDEAIEACDVAASINPWLVTEGSLSSIFANHRANMDQPINRIRFYMNVLIKTLKGY